MGGDFSKLRIAFELPSNEALCAAVENSTLATAVSVSVAKAKLDTGALLAMPLTIGRREFRLITHVDRSLSRATSAFLDTIKTFAS